MSEVPRTASSVYVVSLGCPKNRVDSERMTGGLLARGWVLTDDRERADVLLVNTCAFIQPATEESIETILELVQGRQAGQRLVVTGCMVQRYGERLARELPEVDVFLGTGELDRLPALLEREEGAFHLGQAGYLEPGDGPRAGLWRPHSAYLKVTEGCHRRCSYCIIPSLRGNLRSRPLEPLVQEAQALVRQGVREICVVGQDTTAWGKDLPREESLATLLEALAGIQDLAWIRILYAHPLGIDDRLLDTIAGHDAICSYLDLPLQHVAAPVLRAMGRGSDRPALERLVARIRRRIPGVVLRTTFMVGFPGETAADFDELLGFVQDQGFERAGVFRYFAEEGTRAATLPRQVPEALQQQRHDALVDAQAQVSAAYHRGLVGQHLQVLVDGPSPEHDLLLAGRHRGQAPEVDGVVHLGIPFQGARPGCLYQAVVTDADEVDVVAEIVDDGLTAG